ncbi:MAG: tetratricopeptide repeat protein [Flavisolibacter sp.]
MVQTFSSQSTTPLIMVLTFLFFSCTENKEQPTKEMISALNLKRGTAISCGPPGAEYGSLAFETSCNKSLAADFNLAIKMLHSFEYEEAEKVFASVIDKDPSCAMAYWGVAMSNFHPLWAPPSEPELVKGSKAIAIGKSLADPGSKAAAYLAAIESYYKNWETVKHPVRCLQYEKAMETLYAADKNDKEASVFYALSLMAAADPTDKTFAKQKKAGDILQALYPGNPQHPGIVHYIIHTYDYPELAQLGLDAARKYAEVAPSSAHALHMPSHIFTRLGLWTECISINERSVYAAKCYAEQSGLKGHWDEELHGLDYLVYAHLQKGDNTGAQKQLDYLSTIKQVDPMNFKVAYAFSAIPARYALENRDWKAAAALSLNPVVPWERFAWQEAILHFAKTIGLLQTGQLDAAQKETALLEKMHQQLLTEKDAYKATQVEIQLKAAKALMHFKKGEGTQALAMMKEAAEMENKTEKHPVTPCEVIPAGEMLADLLMEMKQPSEALTAYEASLKKNPNRFNALYNAGMAARQAGDQVKATAFYKQLIAIADPRSAREELKQARAYLQKDIAGL